MSVNSTNLYLIQCKIETQKNEQWYKEPIDQYPTTLHYEGCQNMKQISSAEKK